MRIVSVALALAISLLVAGNVMAQQEKGPENKGKRCWTPPFPFLKGLDLTADQKTKLDALKKEYQPKFQDFRKTMESILTPEQKEARKEAAYKAHQAVKEAQEAVKKAQEAAQKAIDAAVTLTSEQKTKMEEAKKQNGAVYKEFRSKIMDVLTPEQKQQLEKRGSHKKDRKDSDASK